MNSTHGVVRRRSDFHRLLGNVDVGQLLELVIHARQFTLNVFGRVRKLFFDPRDIEIHTAVRSPPALLDLAHDAARDVVARQQLRRAPRVLVALTIAPALFCVVSGLRAIVFRDRIEHEALPFVVR